MFRHLLLSVIFSLTLQSMVAQNGRPYMIPDIGVPGYASYIEIIGTPGNDLGSNIFGTDGVYLNNSGSAVRVTCLNPEDTSKVVFGPVTVSWEGQMISTHAFINKDLEPNSHLWHSLEDEFRIPVKVIKTGGQVIFIDTLYLVNPTPALISNTPGSFGSGGEFGIRSPRGAIIFEDIDLRGNGAYLISTADCDPFITGNQGYLPVTIISLGNIAVGANAAISTDAIGINAGPGGGGGGAGSQNGPGGNGFTGGGYSCNGSVGSSSGQPSPTIFEGNYSLNGVSGGDGICDQGSGGGTGHPFGKSGRQGKSQQLTPFPGGYGGGSAGGETVPGEINTNGGGGGGNATEGESGDGNLSSNGGKKIGNDKIVPLFGGSGGGAGNVWYTETGGNGGGGGGALNMFAFGNTTLAGRITSIGGAGTDGERRSQEWNAESGGGGGSGGNIIVGCKHNHNGVITLDVSGGEKGLAYDTTKTTSKDGGKGAPGRVRIDGKTLNPVTVETSGATIGNGPVARLVSSDGNTKTISGTASGETVRIYIKPKNKAWKLYSNYIHYGSEFSGIIHLDGLSEEYYMVASQVTSNKSNTLYENDPAEIMGWGSAEILDASLQPVAFDDAVAVKQQSDTLIDVLKNDSLWNNDVTLKIINNPKNGLANIQNDSIFYDPADDYYGPDSLSYEICLDSEPLTCSEAKVYIDVVPPNYPPQAKTDYFDFMEDATDTLYVLDNDFDINNDSLFVSDIPEGPFHGYAFIAEGALIYSPESNFTGLDTIVYQVCEYTSQGFCDTDTAFINVTNVNDPPVILDEYFNPTDTIRDTIPEDTMLSFCLNVEDQEGNATSIVNIHKIDASGSLAVDISESTLCLLYSTEENFTGNDYFQVIVRDDQNPSGRDTAVIAITVEPSNDPPVIYDFNYQDADTIRISTSEDLPLPFCLNVLDPDNEVLNATIIKDVSLGQLTQDENNNICFDYYPPENVSGFDTAFIVVCDGGQPEYCDSAVVIFEITPVNDEPQILNSAGAVIHFLQDTTIEESPKEICLKGFDAEGNNITLISGESINNKGGSVYITNAEELCLSYTPAENFFGDEFLELRFCDDGEPELCNTIQVQFTVLEQNDEPIAANDSISVNKDQIANLYVLNNDTDPDNDALLIEIIQYPRHGTAIVINNYIQYTPAIGYSGADNLQYRICDSDGLCSDATVFIDIIPTNQIHIPNAFTPNGDGVNDFFVIPNLMEKFPVNKFVVYNRWGDSVFESENYQNNWNGTYQGKSLKAVNNNTILPEGTYFYILELTDVKIKKSGFIILKH